MYYLVIQSMGTKKCIAASDTNDYDDEQYYDCMQSLPFNEEGKTALSIIFIRCISIPQFQRRATIYSD
jgi:hypothetical protein